MSQPSHRRPARPRPGWRRRAALVAAGAVAGLAVGAVAGLVAGAPLLGAAPAHADPVESGRQVTFSGNGLLSVSCAANPSTGSVTVPAETTLRVINRTGHRATLLLDGAARGEVAAGAAADVLFHRGPVQLALEPHCVLSDQRSVRVRVVAPTPTAAGPVFDPVPPPSAAGADQRPPAGGAPGAVTGGSTGREGTGRAPATNGRPDAHTLPLPGVREDEPDAAATEPGSGAADDAPAPAATPAIAAGAEAAAEPLASVEPVGSKAPIGLLAVIATVCVLGVSVAAIRAILAQRTSRAGLALN